MALCRRGEELQKKLCSTDGARPAVDLEQETGVLRDAFALFHGSEGSAARDAVVPEAQRTQPASPAGVCMCGCVCFVCVCAGACACMCRCVCFLCVCMHVQVRVFNMCVCAGLCLCRCVCMYVQVRVCCVPAAVCP